MKRELRPRFGISDKYSTLWDTTIQRKCFHYVPIYCHDSCVDGVLFSLATVPHPLIAFREHKMRLLWESVLRQCNIDDNFLIFLLSIVSVFPLGICSDRTMP